MSESEIEFLTTECPNGHRVRGDIGWLNRKVRCPHCHSEFVFKRPESSAANVVEVGQSQTKSRTSVTDTGVMRILGDLTNLPPADDGSTRRCSQCGAIFPSYVPVCYSCNVQLEAADAPVADVQNQSEGESESIDFQALGAFPFDDITIRKAMRPRKEIVFLDINDTLEKMLDRVQETQHHQYPVCDRSLENLAGIVHVEDLLIARELEFDVQKIARPLEAIPETTPVSEVLQLFAQKNGSVALVVDEYDTVIGLVTTKDILLKMVKR